MIEKAHGLEVGAIGIEPQIENAIGLTNINEIATASPRVQTLVFGPRRLHGEHQHAHPRRR